MYIESAELQTQFSSFLAHSDAVTPSAMFASANWKSIARMLIRYILLLFVAKLAGGLNIIYSKLNLQDQMSHMHKQI